MKVCCLSSQHVSKNLKKTNKKLLVISKRKHVPMYSREKQEVPIISIELMIMNNNNNSANLSPALNMVTSNVSITEKIYKTT